MKHPMYVKQERFSFPTGNTLRVLTTRGFRRRFRQGRPSPRVTAAILHLMLVHNVRALRNRQERHRFVGLLHRDGNGVAMAHRVLSGGPLVTLEGDGVRVPVYLEDVVAMEGIVLLGIRRIQWHRMYRFHAMIHALLHAQRMQQDTGFKIVRNEQQQKDLFSLTEEQYEVEMGIRRSARRALHQILRSLHTEMHPCPVRKTRRPTGLVRTERDPNKNRG